MNNVKQSSARGHNGGIWRRLAAVLKGAEVLDARLAADLRGQIAAIHRSQAVIEFQLDGTILDANANFLGAMGYSIDEVRGRHHSLFVDPEQRGRPATTLSSTPRASRTRWSSTPPTSRPRCMPRRVCARLSTKPGAC
jgi:PAS domain-containing protein